jgi:DNA-binding GntR family transcriptional regulator
MNGDPVAWMKGRNTGPNRIHFTGDFMAGDQRFANDKVANPTFGKVMQIGSAYTTSFNPHFDLMLTDRGHVPCLKAKILRPMNDTGLHRDSHPEITPKKSGLLRCCHGSMRWRFEEGFSSNFVQRRSIIGYLRSSLTFCHGSIHCGPRSLVSGVRGPLNGPILKDGMVMVMPPANSHLRLAVQVFETVREEIVSGALPPNTQLSEAELSERLGVSRTPVREALIKLSEDGLVRVVPQVGSFVAPISIDSVREAQFIRENLECALIVDAANKIDAASLRRMRDNIDQQDRAARDSDWNQFYGLDESLHAMLAAVSGHVQAWRVISQSKVHMDRVRHVSFRMPDHMAKLITQHTAIVDAVASGDAGSAQKALRGHLREIFATVEKLGLVETSE